MIDKEKQTEEMVKSCKNCVHNVVCDKKLNLKYFFDNHDCEHYQPKLSKDSVVLSKEEWECLHNDYAKALYNARKNERKETAEKFIKECKKYKVKKFSPIGIDQRDAGVTWIEMPEWKFDEFIKQFEAEIKES